MSEQPAGEKTFAPTEKRKRDAVKKGDVLRSKEVATAAAIIAGGGWLALGGPWLVDAVEQVARSAFSFERSALEDPMPGALLTNTLAGVLPPVLLLGLSVTIATVAAQMLLGEGRWVAGNLAPKGSRLNPVSGLGRMFGTHGLIELGKSLLKLGLLAGIAWFWAAGELVPLLGLGRGELRVQLPAAWSAFASLTMMLALGLLVIALIDWPIQYVRRLQRLRMTQQEMRDESKEAEGSPQRRAAQRQRQREFARGGVMRAVKDAQFILANPSHFAVALTYDPALAPAPVVLAKGRGDKALAMRELATEFGVPLLEYPQLARSVYFTTRPNQVIREELYVAIAALVAFVMSLKRGEHPPRPSVEVPVALRFDAEGRASRA